MSFGGSAAELYQKMFVLELEARAKLRTPQPPDQDPRLRQEIRALQGPGPLERLLQAVLRRRERGPLPGTGHIDATLIIRQRRRDF